MKPKSEELVTPESKMNMAPNSNNSKLQELVEPDSEMVPDSLLPLDSEMVPDSLPPGAFVCARYHVVHENREAWNRVHSRFRTCSRCNLDHEDYRVAAMLHGLDNFDCFVFIPDLDELEMDGRTIILSREC
jgi:hypothetical protein